MKKALILAGGWEGHQPRECAELFAERLPARGLDVEIHDSIDVLNDAAWVRNFAVVIPLWTMGTLPPAATANLVSAVQGGVGLAGFHGGMGDAFRGNVEYQWMVGGLFAAHPDNIKPYEVEIIEAADPIVKGISRFSVHTEQYYMLVDPANEVLATTTFHSLSAPWVNGTVMPVVWKKRYGQGRVFYCSLGHQRQEFIDVPQQLEITLRGIAWAAG